MARFRPNKGAINELVQGPAALAALRPLAEAIAVDARKLAPRDSGEGARSIHAVYGADSVSAHADIAWDQDHFYMAFAEFGTSKQTATPFLRPALRKSR